MEGNGMEWNGMECRFFLSMILLSCVFVVLNHSHLLMMLLVPMVLLVVVESNLSAAAAAAAVAAVAAMGDDVDVDDNDNDNDNVNLFVKHPGRLRNKKYTQSKYTFLIDGLQSLIAFSILYGPLSSVVAFVINIIQKNVCRC
jgi:hypothetical protein